MRNESGRRAASAALQVWPAVQRDTSFGSIIASHLIIHGRNYESASTSFFRGDFSSFLVYLPVFPSSWYPTGILSVNTLLRIYCGYSVPGILTPALSSLSRRYSIL